ncbi:MAG: DUF1853 family protein [Pseudomonadota bacterium]
MPIQYDTLIESLRDPAVRDLAWVIGAPNLLDPTHPSYHGRTVDDAWCQARLELCAPWLAALDQQPHNLHQFIAAQPTRRLGRYFELLLGYFLAHLPDIKILASNLQVQDAHRTLGEYDLLFRDRQTGTAHWEAAIKFYLQLAPIPAQHSFIGPGGRDRLDLKLQRVFSHQLLLSDTTAGKLALPAGITLDRAQAYIKGYLFYSLHEADSRPAPLAIPGVSATHLRGWWIRHPVAMLPQIFPDSAWAILPRMRWLAPLLLEESAKVMSNAEMCRYADRHFDASSEALLLAELQPSAGAGWREAARGFVVANSWPQIT